MSQATISRPLPPLAEPRHAEPPQVTDKTLPNGLRVMIVQRSAVPLVEVRLRVPFAGTSDELPIATLLGETMLSGTSTHTDVTLAAALQALGGGLGASVDADRLLLAGNTLATGLPGFLELLSTVVTDAQYPDPQVAVEREHLADHIEVALSQSSTAARAALVKRLYGDHPYAVELPTPAQVREVAAEQLRALHASKVLPAGSTLILVGDVEAEETVRLAETVFAGWATSGVASEMPPIPALVTGPTLLVNREGSVQSSIRYAFESIRRTDPDYPALQLANLIFAGYFSSRLVSNIREDKGYTYSAHSSIEHSVAGSVLTMDADVASEVTAQSLLEIDYELGRLATSGPTAEEVEDVRQYAIGTLALSIATQSGLASTLSALVGIGLGPDWLEAHPQRLAEVTVEQVAQAAAKYLTPANAIRVVLGDADAIRSAVSVLAPIQE
ncbi:MAG: insulinase family protein [Corynebacteriales bacterium]|nr:insulinase family protein [Mycobacteriales bacterium]